MMAQTASPTATMRSLGVRKYGVPSEYEVLELPIPAISNPTDVLIRVHAAGIQTGDTQMAGGSFKLVAKAKFPFKISLGGAGVVSAIGPAVTAFKPGDPVYGAYFKHGHVFPPPAPGFASDYVVCPADVLLPKPSSLSFEEAAALAGSVVTAAQCIQRYFELTGQPRDTASLEGKTVFVPGALSACGSVFVQVVKNVFGAEGVISTVSTAKMGLVKELLPEGVVDMVLDYKTQNVVKEVGKGKVDLVLNTQWDMVGTFPLVEPTRGAVVSIASVPSERTVRKMVGESEKVPFLWLVVWVLRAAHWWYAWKLRGTNVKQDFVSGNMGDRETVEKSGEWVAAGKIKAVMTVVDLDDIEAVRKHCQMVATGKGGLGKLVVKLV